jgi:excisionase family DNA binding protein
MQTQISVTPEQFVDGQRAAEFLGMPRKTILNLARQGSIPAHPLGDGLRHTWRFRLSELAAWVESRRRPIASVPPVRFERKVS